MKLFSMNRVSLRLSALIALAVALVGAGNVTMAAPLASPYVGKASLHALDAKRDTIIRNQYIPSYADAITPHISRLHPWDVLSPSAASASVAVNSTVQTIDLTLPTYTAHSSVNTTGVNLTLNASGVPDTSTAAPANIDPVWSSDESFIIFASNRTSAVDPTPTGFYHLYLLRTSGYSNTDPSTLVQLTGIGTNSDAAFSQRYPALLSPGDNTIVYTQYSSGSTSESLIKGTLSVASNVSVTAQTALAPGLDVQHPTILGSSIIFAARTAGSIGPYHIYEVNIVSNAPAVQVTFGTADEENPSFSNQGSLIAFDSNASGYDYVNQNQPNLESTGTAATRNIWVTSVSGQNIVQFTTAGGNNVTPVWTPVTPKNPFFNPDSSNTREYIFYASDRNTGKYGIYYLRAQPSGGTQAVTDTENQANGGAVNTAVQVNASDPSAQYDSYSPAVSQLNSFLQVAYVSNRYLVNGNNDNPVANPTSENSAIAINPLNFPTGTSSASTGLNTELLASRLIDIDPPTLLRYNDTTTAIIEVEDPLNPNTDGHQFNAGDTVNILVRLSDRQSGIGAAYLQIKNPDSATQDQGTTGLEHKVYSRSTSTLENGDPSPYANENDEAVKYEQDGLDSAAFGSYNVALAHTVETRVSNGVSQTLTANVNDDARVLPVGDSTQYHIGDTVHVQGATDITTYVVQTVKTSSASTITIFDPLGAGALSGTPVTVVGHRAFVPQGIEIDCQALDLSKSPFDATSSSDYLIPFYLPSEDDSTILSGFENPSRPEWLTLLPLSTTVPAAITASATTFTVVSSSGFATGDTVQIDTGLSEETGTISSVSGNVITLTTGVTNAHAAGATITEVASAGGGVIYSTSWQTPIVPSDYYFDIIAYDNAQWPVPYDTGSVYTTGEDFSTANSQNWRIYDNVGGMSTAQFSSSHSILVVNDHALPQKFLSGRFSSNGTSGVSNAPQFLYGSESYLTGIDTTFIDPNYSGETDLARQYPTASLPDAAISLVAAAGVTDYVTPLYDRTCAILGFNFVNYSNLLSSNAYVPSSNSPLISEAFQNTLGTNSYTESDVDGSALTDSQGYDIWRILSRGTIPQSVLNAYAPTAAHQPADPSDTNSKAQWVLNAGSCLLWMSPLTGDQYIEAGSLADSTIQAELTAYQKLGGRMLIEGNDIGYDFTSQGSASTAFAFYTNVLSSELISDTLSRNEQTFALNMATGQADYISHDAFLNNTNSFMLFSDASNIGHLAFCLPIGGDNTYGLVYSPPSSQGTVTVSNFGDGTATFPKITDGSPNADTRTLSIMNAYASNSTTATKEITGINVQGLDSGGNVINGTNMLMFTGNPADNVLPLDANGNIKLDGSLAPELYAGAITAVSSFGFETLSQKTERYTIGARDVMLELNQRTNLMHNLVCMLRTGHITGRVLVSGTGNQPLGGATVVAFLNNQSALSYRSTSNSNGDYQIDGVPAGRYTIVATNQIGITGTYQHTTSNAVDVHGGATSSRNVTVNIVQPATVTVTVLDRTSGGAISGAVVTLTGTSGTVAPYTAVTNALGVATFSGVLIGTYTASATATNYAVDSNSFETGQVVTGTTIALGTLSLDRINGGLAGVVTNSVTAALVAGATVALQNTDGTAADDTVNHLPLTATTATDGTYQLSNTPGGTYNLVISKAGYITQTITLTTSTTAVKPQNVSLVPTQQIVGVVTNNVSPFAPIAGATVTISLGGTVVNTETTDANGAYATPNPTAPGSYSIVASDAGYITSTAETVVVTAGAATTAPTIQLALIPTVISGQVTDTTSNAGIGGAVVTITLTGGSALTVTADVNGNYTSGNLAPGVYTLIASASNYQTTSPAVSVTLVSGTSQTVPLALTRNTLATFNPIAIGSGFGLKMITVPYEFTESGGTLATNLTGSSGSKLAVWDPTQDIYDVTPQSPANTFHRGIGYWIRLTETAVVTGSPDPQDSSHPPFSINLKPGWNMIGDPWTASVTTVNTNIVSSTGTVMPFVTGVADGFVDPTIYTWSASTSAYISTDATSGSTQLTALVGYWIHVLKACTLQVPSPQ